MLLSAIPFREQSAWLLSPGCLLSQQMPNLSVQRHLKSRNSQNHHLEWHHQRRQRETNSALLAERAKVRLCRHGHACPAAAPALHRVDGIRSVGAVVEADGSDDADEREERADNSVRASMRVSRGSLYHQRIKLAAQSNDWRASGNITDLDLSNQLRSNVRSGRDDASSHKCLRRSDIKSVGPQLKLVLWRDIGIVVRAQRIGRQAEDDDGHDGGEPSETGSESVDSAQETSPGGRVDGLGFDLKVGDGDLVLEARRSVHRIDLLQKTIE